MATDASQLDFGTTADAAEQAAPPMVNGSTAQERRTFGGFSLAQIGIGALLLFAAIWAMWTTREVLALRQHTVVSVRLGELVNQFALAEARSGDDPDKVTARTRAFMTALDRVLKQRSAAGAVVLVGEAVISSSTQDITQSVAADVAKLVPLPVAQALPPRMPVAPVQSSSAGSAASVPQQTSPFGSAPADQQDGYAPSGYQPAAGDPSADQGGGDGKP